MSSSRPELSAATAPPRPSLSLAARLTAWYACSAFLLILGVMGFLYWALLTNLDREDDQLLANKIHILRRVLRDRPEEVAAMAQEVEWQQGRHMTILVRVLDNNQTMIMETPGMEVDLPPRVFPPPAGLDVEPGPGVELETSPGKFYRIAAAQAATPESATATHLLQVAMDSTFEEHLLADYRRNLIIVVGAALVACAGIGYMIARHGLRPLHRMAATASRINSATLNERLAIGGLPGELATLAFTFNAMLDRLEESFQRLARFSADIAHELRTPVNNLRGEAEVALGKARSPEEYCEVLGSVLEECGRLSQLIDNLLFLARTENPESHLAKEPVDIGREIATVCSMYEAAAEEAGVCLETQIGEGLVVPLDRSLFQRSIGNLVSNALAHTPAGGRVTLAAGRDGDTLRIEVHDTGRGIAAEHLPFVFDRFYRADPARTGAAGRVGLGLALVKHIVELHRGSVAIASEVGKGTRVYLTLPGLI